MKKLGVLGDIHSCAPALRACVARLLAEGAEGFLLLGDYLTNCPDPEETMDQLRDLMARYPCYALRGNREEYLLRWQSGEEKGWTPSPKTGSLLYTAIHLSEESWRWLETLPQTLRVEVAGCPPLRIAHGSPQVTRGFLYPNYRACREALEKLDTDWLVCGHTHRQGIFRWQGRTLINPGAVHWRNTACCALLTGTADGWTAELLTLPYDTGAYARQVLQSGMAPMAPVWTQVVAEELRTGGDLLEPWIAGSIAGVKQKGLTDAREVFGCWYRQAEELGVPLPPLEEMLAACLST